MTVDYADAAKKRPPGRPPIETAKRTVSILAFRVTAEEARRIRYMAEYEGLSVSRYVRLRVLGLDPDEEFS